MIKHKYFVTGALCFAIAMSATGCGNKTETTEEITTAVAETENPNYVPYVQPEVKDLDQEYLDNLDVSPHFDSYSKLQDMLEENAQAESRGASEIIIDDTGAEVEETEAETAYSYIEDNSTEKSLDGGSNIEIAEVQSFEYMSPKDGSVSNGDILIFSNSDYIEIDPKIKSAGYTYTVDGHKLSILLDDGRKVEMICVGNGFVDSNAFTVKSMTKLIQDNCDFNTDGAVVNSDQNYMNNTGAQDLIKIISGDQSDLATIYRSLNATYVMFYDGNLPYSYMELDQLVRPLKLN